jgi:hypothetical protein
VDVSRWIISIFCTVTRGEISRYFVVYLTSKCLNIFSFQSWWIFWVSCRISQWFASIFCRKSHVEYYSYKRFLGVSQSALLFCWTSYGELSRYFGGTAQLNMSIFCRMTHVELSGYFVGHLTLNYLGILSDVPLWIFSIFCRKSDSKLRPYFFGGLTVNNLNILSGISRWIFSLFRVTIRGDYSRFFGCLTVNYLNFFVQRLKVNIPDILSAILSRILNVQTPYFQLRHYKEESDQFHSQ